ncbi:MAG: DedA family protein [Deltaproteobacteria bacterium]|nr:DedA family protein [Deltaproteobacteria bacterium]
MDWLINHLSTLSASSVYWTLGGILLLCGLGLPFPEDISLICAGYLAHRGVVDVHTVFTLCLAAVLVGDGLAFGMGWRFGQAILRWKSTQRYFTPRKQRRVRAYFRKFGSKVIFIARFLPGLRFSIFFSAGMLRVRPTVFVVYDTLASIVSVPALVYLAYYFGDHIDHVIAWSRRSEYGIMGIFIVVGAVIAIKLTKQRRRHRACAAQKEAPGQTPPIVRKSSPNEQG